MPAPNSYKDPYWTDLAAATEARVGLPQGLLSSIITRGERSNHDQVSEAGAKTVFQITPGTRKAAIDKYGVDAYLSPENAAEVAGLLLKDSLDRNNGSVPAAVAEYHGGVDRANWGPRTRSYVARVVGEQKKITAGQPAGGSTFDRVMAANPQWQQPTLDSSQIGQVYQAYKSGKMTPDEAAQFEGDVKSGLVMLPRGATLNGQQTSGPTDKPAPVVLPKEITDAYQQGRLSDQERKDLENDVRAGLVQLPPSSTDMVPGGPNWQPPTEHAITQQEKEPTLGQKLMGLGEAGLSTVTGAVGGTAGMVAGAGNQLVQNVLNGTFGTQQAADLVEKAAMEGAQTLTYEPRTETGRQYAGAVGDAVSQTLPALPFTAELGAIGQGARNMAPAVSSAIRTGATTAAGKAGQALEAIKPPVTAAVDAVKSAPGRAMEAVGLKTPPAPEPTYGTAGSAGAAGTDVATMRQIDASSLPAPIQLTKGQATRDFGQLRFEQEAAKNPELGAPIRERMDQQQAAIRQSFEKWLDDTGAQAPDSRAVGITVDKALTAKAARDKAEIRVAYKNAEKAGELEAPVSTQPVVDTLNASQSAESTAPVLTAARKELIRLGGATEDANGQLVPQDLTLSNAEQLRKFVNKITGNDPTNIKFAGDVKRAIDQSTEGAGGELYSKARALRAKYADQYENRAVISDLLNNKRGTSDRRVALEDVADRVLFRGSLDDLQFAGRLIKRADPQAWQEIQGSAIKYIRDEATKNVARDATGNPIISPAALDKAIKRLDNDGKLDYLFGKANAEKLRTVNDLAKVMFSVPPGAVNTSNTASVLLAALDMGVSSSAGLPLPVMSGLRMLLKHVKDRKLRARIQDALGKQR